ncbi:MAG TPA: low specificity L-threonine aldolase [Alphaproteobacteria bacterium]|nr:low specificity L-threonine aldolase [Alphaproteobacteria bacterium]
MNFCSDNVAGAAPAVLEALTAGASGTAMPYGNDPATARVGKRLEALFGTALAAFPVATGTAANALALSVVTPPYGAVYCHRDSHINVDECGAPELFTGGAKLMPLDGAHGKLDPETLSTALARGGAGDVHHVQPAALSLSQATEAGTVYAPDEVRALADIAHTHGLAVHMDGARFANAVASLGCTPAELSWKAGIDVLSFGATKNGCLAAEAVLFFDPARAGDFVYRRKRGGHLFSKMRFVSLQLDAYLADGLWLDLARHANTQAGRLAEGLGALEGAVLIHPVQANEIFVRLPEPVLDGLESAGFGFYRWDGTVIRLVTAFNTDPAHVDALIAAARRLSAEAGARKMA